jgi:hypothetical protein
LLWVPTTPSLKGIEPEKWDPPLLGSMLITIIYSDFRSNHSKAWPALGSLQNLAFFAG